MKNSVKLWLLVGMLQVGCSNAMDLQVGSSVDSASNNQEQQKSVMTRAQDATVQANEIIARAFKDMDRWMSKNAFLGNNLEVDRSSKAVTAIQKIDKALDALGSSIGSVSGMQTMKAAVARTIEFFSTTSTITKKGTISNKVLAGIVNSVKAAIRIPVVMAVQLSAQGVGTVAGAAGGAVGGFGAGVHRAFTKDRSVFKTAEIDNAVVKATKKFGNIVAQSLYGIVNTARLTAYGAAEGTFVGGVVVGVTPSRSAEKILESHRIDKIGTEYGIENLNTKLSIVDKHKLLQNQKDLQQNIDDNKALSREVKDQEQRQINDSHRKNSKSRIEKIINQIQQQDLQDKAKNIVKGAGEGFLYNTTEPKLEIQGASQPTTLKTPPTEAEIAAATKIQAIQRGRLARKAAEAKAEKAKAKAAI
jgi:hypothetical protein